MAPKPLTLKKLAVIGLLAVLFYGQMGYYFAWKYAQCRWKETMRHSLLAVAPDEQLVTISLNANKNAIDWEEEGREFRLHGQLYDVVRTRPVNGDTILYCVNDIKEKQLITHLNAVNPSREHQAKGPGIPAFKPVLDPVIMTDTCIANFAESGSRISFIYTSPLPECSLAILSPPPRG